MDVLTLAILMVTSFALAVAGARTVLVLVFRMMIPADTNAGLSNTSPSS